jgi:hypothetical protein
MNCVETQLARALLDVHMVEAQLHTQYGEPLRVARLERQGWLSRGGCWLLGHMGQVLVAAGHQLQQYGMPQLYPVKGKPSPSG